MKYKTLLLLMMFVAVSFLLPAQGLKVEPGTCIKVETGTTLDISGGDLFLKSDASGDASLIDLGNVSYTGGGEAKVERYLTNGKWHLVSSPITAALSGMFESDFLQVHTESTNAYTDVSSLTYGLIPAKGYALWSVETEPSTEIFTGTTNTGSQSFDFTKSDLPDDDDEGWNFVGNPYPSVLDWDEVTKPANLSATIWLFDPTIGENGDYRYYIKDAGKANFTSQYIPSGQGFFVRSTEGDGTGTLTFDNSARTHNDETVFYKSDVENMMLVLKATGNNITTQTAIRFKEEATAQIDRLYDVNKITSGSPDVPVVYTLCENQNMAINTLPSIKGNEIVPLYFEAGMDGSYAFTATEMETLGDEIPVFLEDIALNYIQDLRANPDYSFEYASGAVKEFNIHFKDATGIEQPEKLNVLCYLNNNMLHVNFPESEFGKATISVYNITGQQILIRQTSLANNDIAFNGSQAVYLVSITTNEGVFSTKVFNR